MVVVICPRDRIIAIWPLVEPMLEKALKYSEGREDINGIYRSVAHGDGQLWVMAIDRQIVAAATTELLKYPRRKVLRVKFLGGSRMTEWLPSFIAKLKKFAEYNNADGIEFLGRPGWTKVLGKFGFCAQKIVFMECRLNG